MAIKKFHALYGIGYCSELGLIFFYSILFQDNFANLLIERFFGNTQLTDSEVEIFN